MYELGDCLFRIVPFLFKSQDRKDEEVDIYFICVDYDRFCRGGHSRIRYRTYESGREGVDLVSRIGVITGIGGQSMSFRDVVCRSEPLVLGTFGGVIGELGGFDIDVPDTGLP